MYKLLIALLITSVNALAFDNVDGTTFYGVGKKSSSTTIVTYEFGNQASHKTVIKLTASPVVMTNNSGVALYGGIGTGTTTAIYTFPRGAIKILGADVRGNLTLTTAGALATYASINSLGSVTSANDATLTGTEANILASTSAATAAAKVAALKSFSLVDTVPYDGTMTAMPMFLNFVVANDASNSTGVGTFTGTVTVSWVNLTNN